MTQEIKYIFENKGIFENKEYSYYELMNLFRNISFPKKEESLSVDFLSTIGVKKIIVEPQEVSVEEKKRTVRNLRDEMLQGSDKYLLSDYPISQLELDTVKAWRQYLRDYTNYESWWENNPMDMMDYINEDGGINYE